MTYQAGNTHITQAELEITLREQAYTTPDLKASDIFRGTIERRRNAWKTATFSTTELAAAIRRLGYTSPFDAEYLAKDILKHREGEN